MKPKNLISVLFGLMFVLLLTGTVVLSFRSRNAAPVLADVPEAAEQQTQALMDALCSGDRSTVSALIAGAPELQAAEPQNPLSQFLWGAYWESLSYEFTGGCYASDTGLAREVNVTLLDIPSVVEAMQVNSAALLMQAAMELGPEAYTEDGSYREDFIMEVLAQAAQEVLKEDGHRTSRTMVLELICRNGQWQIQPKPALVDLLSGGMGGI